MPCVDQWTHIENNSHRILLEHIHHKRGITLPTRCFNTHRVCCVRRLEGEGSGSAAAALCGKVKQWRKRMSSVVRYEEAGREGSGGACPPRATVQLQAVSDASDDYILQSKEQRVAGLERHCPLVAGCVSWCGRADAPCAALYVSAGTSQAAGCVLATLRALWMPPMAEPQPRREPRCNLTAPRRRAAARCAK